MAHTVTLNDDEYAALAALAAREGRTLEELVRATLAERLARTPDPATTQPSPTTEAPAEQEPPEQPRMSQEEFAQLLYRQGIIRNIPDRQPLSPEEEEEREQLANSVGPGTPVSDMVIEDRGSR